MVATFSRTCLRCSVATIPAADPGHLPDAPASCWSDNADRAELVGHSSGGPLLWSGGAGSGGNVKVIDTSVTATCPKGYSSLNWNQACPRARRQGRTNGTNGSSVVTSAGVPASACNPGDTDVDLATGEVYTCVAGGVSIAGDGSGAGAGKAGPPGELLVQYRLQHYGAAGTGGPGRHQRHECRTRVHLDNPVCVRRLRWRRRSDVHTGRDSADTCRDHCERRHLLGPKSSKRPNLRLRRERARVNNLGGC